MYCVLREISVSYLILLSIYFNFFICFTRMRLNIDYFKPFIKFNKNINVLNRLRLISDIMIMKK